jgi:hypothetical protein
MAFERLLLDHRAPVALHGGVVGTEELSREHRFKLVPGRDAGERRHRCVFSEPIVRRGGQRSIPPNTMSSEPMIDETSASTCPRLKKSIACRRANDGDLHL